jgi:hypothetical protein
MVAPATGSITFAIDVNIIFGPRRCEWPPAEVPPLWRDVIFQTPKQEMMAGATCQFVAQDSMIILPGQTAIDPVIDDLQAGLA